MKFLKRLTLLKKSIIGVAGFFVGFFFILIAAAFSFEKSPLIASTPAFYVVLYPFVFYYLARKIKKMNVRCPNCGFEGIGKLNMKGSSDIELVLYFFLLFPGLIYSLWRGSSRRWICPQCDFENVIKKGMITVD